MTESLLKTRVTKKNTALPLGAILYGPPGSGKTSFAAQFPDTLFIYGTSDQGVLTLKNYGLIREDISTVEVQGFDELISLLDEIIDTEESLPFKYIVLDQFSVFQQMLFEYVCEEEFGGDWGNKGFGGYGQGYSQSNNYLNDLLNQFDAVRKKGIGIIVLAHSEVIHFDHPEFGRYDRYEIDAQKELVKTLKKWADTTLFLDFEMALVSDDDGKRSQGKARAKGGHTRKLCLQKTALYDAKNRFGLTDPILGGETAEDLYANFVEQMKQAIAKNKKAK